MPKVSRESAKVEDHGPVEERSDEVNGYNIGFVTFREDIDSTPLLKGLPGDACQCPHWGYVFKGKLTFRSGDRVETFEAGDAFYVEPGHTQMAEMGTEYLQFSPADELAAVSEMLLKNLQKMQAS